MFMGGLRYYNEGPRLARVEEPRGEKEKTGGAGGGPQ